METTQDKIGKILEQFLGRLPEPDPEWPFRVRKAVGFIHHHLFDEKLTVGWIKAELDITNNNFSTKFRYYTGKGPKRYFDHLRLEAARQVLVEVDSNVVTVINVTLEVGFQNPSAFKKRYGFPPGDLLKQQKK